MINNTIKQAVCDYLDGILSPSTLYLRARFHDENQAILHEIAKIEIELEDGWIIPIYNVEKYIYDMSNSDIVCNSVPFCKRGEDFNKKAFHEISLLCKQKCNVESVPADYNYTVYYDRNYVYLSMLSLRHSTAKIKLPIREVRCLSKKDVSITDLIKRYNTYGNIDVFGDTQEFQVKYGLMEDKEKPAAFLPDENMKMKIGHLQEELDEVKKAYANKDLAETADRLLDLIYVASGLCNLMNLPTGFLWNDIQNSNMAYKERVKSLDNATKRGSTFDVRKTEKWIAPRGKEIIEEINRQIEAKKTESDKRFESNEGWKKLDCKIKQ